ncbi:carbohydrate kinase family protein [Kitasatospora sp. NPDC093806]|uniref:carbohydrate kinase family protein n=1 Tax=Kitasatospora sp. NPDC093806 TaxID=3155075 RepID=UPI0034122F8C
MTNDSGRRCEVLVAGAYFADLVFRGLAEPLRPGGEVFAAGFDLVPGGAYNAAMALHRLGRAVVWATDFGTDPFSAQVLAAARREGLDERGFRHHPGAVRSVTAALSGPDGRTMISYQDAVDEQPLVPLVRAHRPRVLLLPQLRYDATALAALRVARELGTLVVMDCQDVPVTLDSPGVRETLTLVDVFAPNEVEALRLTGAATVDEALAELGGLAGTVVVKRGAEGAAAVRDGKRQDRPAPSVDALDTTGAGDCFNAGLVHGLLAGRELTHCLALAVACGAIATTGPGSSAAPTADELSGWVGEFV